MTKRHANEETCVRQWFEFATAVITNLSIPSGIFSARGEFLTGNIHFEGVLREIAGGMSSVSGQLFPEESRSPSSGGHSSGMRTVTMPEGDEPLLFAAVPFEGPSGKALGWLVLVSPSSATSEVSCEERLLTLTQSTAELDRYMTLLAKGDRTKIEALDPGDPLYRLKLRYNEVIDTIDRILSVKGLFGR